MKKNLLKIFVLSSLLSTFGCYDSPQKVVQPAAGFDNNQKKSPGRIEFSEEMHNFGSLKEGEIVSYAFKFSNIGDAPFHLTKVEPTCGCITISFNKDEILGKGNSSFEVVLHTNGEWGNLVKTIDVETSNGEKKTLTIGAYIENSNFNIDLNNSK